MRHMSFALTTAQVIARQKTVTRRIGWKDLKPGTLLQAIEKGQGLKKGEKVRKLAVLRVLNVRSEPLVTLLNNPSYGQREVVAEGFPEMTPSEFVRMFCASHKCWQESDVQRIEFEYMEPPVAVTR